MMEKNIFQSYDKATKCPTNVYGSEGFNKLENH